MKILVTGGTGFIGREVVGQLLEGGHSVMIFSRKGEVPEKFKGKDIEVVQGDLQDFSSLQNALEGTEVFCHIGEIRNISKSAAAKNVALMEHLTATLADAGVKRLVFISSISVSGIPSVSPANETTPPEVVLHDHYTEYKRACEEMIIRKRAGWEYVIIRPAPVYGPGSRYMGRLIDALEKIGPLGFPFIGNARNNAPLIYVKDLARSISLACSTPEAADKVFVMTDGLQHSWFDFFSTIAELLGRKLRLVPVPTLLLKIPAIPLDLFSGIFGVELDPAHYLDYFSRDIFFENSRAKEVLGWEPHYTLTEGIREMVQYYREQH